MNNVSAIPLPKSRVVEIIKEIAADSSNVFWPDSLKQETWRSRVTNLQVQKCIVSGNVIGEPETDDEGNWACRMEWYASGSRVEVLLAIVREGNEKYLVIKDVLVY